MVIPEISILDPTAGRPPRRRRWIPLSLRMFGATLALLTVGSAIVWWRGHVVTQLESAVARELGAHNWSVHYDYEEFEFGYDPAQPPFPRAWYHRALPDGGRPRIVFVSLPSTLPSSNRAEMIERISKLPLVRHLDLGTLSAVSDSEDQEEFERFYYANKIPISEQEFDCIGRMSQLEILTLTGTSTTDACLSRLSGLIHLKRIWLRGTNVTADGVRRLQAALPCAEVHSRFENP